MTASTLKRLVDGGDAPLVVLVPANTERHLLVDFLENLSMLEIAKAFRELTAHPRPRRGTGRGGRDPGRLAQRPWRAWAAALRRNGRRRRRRGLVAKVKELGAGQAW